MRKLFIIISLITFSIMFGNYSNAGDLGSLKIPRISQSPKHENPRCKIFSKTGECLTYAVSIYELLANSEKYHGKVVALGGYVKFGPENNAIYATKEHYLYKLTKDAIWINAEGLNLGLNKNFREGYAYISGTFDRYDGGHFRIFSGALNNIEYFEPIKKR